MSIYIASDCAGFNLKEIIIHKYLVTKNINYKDYGVYSESSTRDYIDITQDLCNEVKSDSNNKGILICGSGVGVTIVANKIKGIRAVLCYNNYIAKYSRLHNDCNIISLGSRYNNFLKEYNSIFEMLDIWLDTDFDCGRHLYRVNKIKDMENDSTS